MAFSHSKLVQDVRKYAAYRRTLRELGTLPLQSRLDLDIYAGDIRKIAHTAVYGY
jgi:uncharacterized protein YjiS (DUF1127 family)